MAVQMRPSQALRLWHDVALALVHSREPDLSVRQISVLITIHLDPQHLPTRLLVAQIYDRGLHDVENALRAYNKVITLSGYESSNPYCTAAREAIDALVTSAPAGFAGQ